MAMALISLTWEIDQGPDCAKKQVFVRSPTERKYTHLKHAHFPCFFLLHIIEMIMVIADRCATISEMGNNARSCYDSSE